MRVVAGNPGGRGASNDTVGIEHPRLSHFSRGSFEIADTLPLHGDNFRLHRHRLLTSQSPEELLVTTAAGIRSTLNRGRTLRSR